MKSTFLLALLGAAFVSGCAYEPVYTTPTPVSVAPAAPTYVVPSGTVVTPGTVVAPATVIR